MSPPNTVLGGWAALTVYLAAHRLHWPLWGFVPTPTGNYERHMGRVVFSERRETLVCAQPLRCYWFWYYLGAGVVLPWHCV